MLEDIRRVVGEHGQITVNVDEIDPHDDLHLLGMTSHATVNLMLALEEHFDIEFPDQMLTRTVFATLANIERSVTELKAVRS